MHVKHSVSPLSDQHPGADQDEHLRALAHDQLAQQVAADEAGPPGDEVGRQAAA